MYRRNTLHISDLPIGFIVDVSTYLEKPMKAIFAAALSASQWDVFEFEDKWVYRPSTISTAILSSEQWDTLNFGYCNSVWVHTLTDDVLYAILTCISAHDVLKKINLTDCINIEGHGLNPLRGSVVLEQMDLRIMRKHVVKLYSPPLICKEIVVPILDSIISADGCSLKYVVFPAKWRDKYTSADGDLYLESFRERYTEHLNNCGINCSLCNESMVSNIWMADGDLFQCNICFTCLRPFCDDCKDCDGEPYILHCAECELSYCNDCLPVKACVECEEDRCEDHLNGCESCSEPRCDDCAKFLLCDGDNCNKANCEYCYDGDVYCVTRCDDCMIEFCNDCEHAVREKYCISSCQVIRELGIMVPEDRESAI